MLWSDVCHHINMRGSTQGLKALKEISSDNGKHLEELKCRMNENTSGDVSLVAQCFLQEMQHSNVWCWSRPIDQFQPFQINNAMDWIRTDMMRCSCRKGGGTKRF